MHVDGQAQFDRSNLSSELQTLLERGSLVVRKPPLNWMGESKEIPFFKTNCYGRCVVNWNLLREKHTFL